jgi:lipopolysaccharide/colanic/teichoic acid biosynthesis glycosyltransferase
MSLSRLPSKDGWPPSRTDPGSGRVAPGADAVVADVAGPSTFDAEPHWAERSLVVRPLSSAERWFDVVLAALLLPFVLVGGLFIAAAVFVDSPGPVLYRSRRVGRDGVEFDMLKFRKMRRHATGADLTMVDDERFTPIGRFLALTKLDEMPQLWNVLRGDMRLVGPRPEVRSFVDAYPNAYRKILVATPGITGPAAVAFASEAKLLASHADVTAFYMSDMLPRKISLDLDYLCERSILGDLGLLLATAVTPVRRIVAWALRRARSTRLEGIPYRQFAYYSAGGALLVAFILSSS